MSWIVTSKSAPLLLTSMIDMQVKARAGLSWGRTIWSPSGSRPYIMGPSFVSPGKMWPVCERLWIYSQLCFSCSLCNCHWSASCAASWYMFISLWAAEESISLQVRGDAGASRLDQSLGKGCCWCLSTCRTTDAAYHWESPPDPEDRCPHEVREPQFRTWSNEREQTRPKLIICQILWMGESVWRYIQSQIGHSNGSGAHRPSSYQKIDRPEKCHLQWPSPELCIEPHHHRRRPPFGHASRREMEIVPQARPFTIYGK